MRKTLALLSMLIVSGAGAVAAAAADDIPRTANGKPDFTGRYDIRSLTPFERLPERGEKLVLSPEEAAEVEAAQAQRVLAGDAASAPDRPAAGEGCLHRPAKLQLRPGSIRATRCSGSTASTVRPS